MTYVSDPQNYAKLNKRQIYPYSNTVHKSLYCLTSTSATTTTTDPLKNVIGALALGGIGAYLLTQLLGKSTGFQLYPQDDVYPGLQLYAKNPLYTANQLYGTDKLYGADKLYGTDQLYGYGANQYGQY
jgi:hypothetical protein